MATNLEQFQGSLADLQTYVSNHPGLVVADFFATWCPPCTRLSAALHGIAEENPNVRFVKIDVDQCRDLAAHYVITSIPHVKFLRQESGQMKELCSVIGADLNQIKEKIRTFSS